MARQRNFRILLTAIFMATQSPRQRISFAGLSGHPLWRSPTISRHSDKTTESSRPVSPQERQLRINRVAFPTSLSPPPFLSIDRSLSPSQPNRTQKKQNRSRDVKAGRLDRC
ncbi:hypothetical protein PoB_007557500 [Plakobranchus ocellatus]|uniref:Secreted protein n=1 Tax=Plakobranchus ocellatus TaxID=259542 RepID=A0AAV4DYH6_9GAST|nr:hypothetical protein PoB_007557500 [Plakobranchus ocellatus]